MLSVLLMLAAVFLVGDGLWVMYSYDGINREGPVGGDAYNYIIWSARGTGLICAGVAAAVLSATLAIIAVWHRR
ncbi:MAG: hypothetical protein WEA80_09110 [Gemmatimonadaceae bacterium]